MVDYETALARRLDREARSYDGGQLQLYGVGIGLGMDPRDSNQLKFLLEDRLEAIPSYASVAGWNVEFTLGLGMEWAKLIHVSERLTLDTPLPASATILVSSCCTEAWDKPGRNATLLVNETTLEDAGSGNRLALLESVYLARDFRLANAPQGHPHALPPPPARDADLEVILPTSPQAALVYRLLGGKAFIHCDPEIAVREGFDGPILHGLSLWGHACHAILKGVGGYEPTRIKSFGADFSAPVYPGERLQTQIWRNGTEVQFQTIVEDRQCVALANGYATLTHGKN